MSPDVSAESALPPDDDLPALTVLHAEQDIDRLRAALNEAADYLERLPPVPETRRLASELREHARPRPPATPYRPGWSRDHEVICHTVHGAPCGVRFSGGERRLKVQVFVPIAGQSRAHQASVEMLDHEPLDDLIAYLCEVRRQIF